jgi:hypothetical protein
VTPAAGKLAGSGLNGVSPSFVKLNKALLLGAILLNHWVRKRVEAMR